MTQKKKPMVEKASAIKNRNRNITTDQKPKRPDSSPFYGEIAPTLSSYTDILNIK